MVFYLISMQNEIENWQIRHDFTAFIKVICLQKDQQGKTTKALWHASWKRTALVGIFLFRNKETQKLKPHKYKQINRYQSFAICNQILQSIFHFMV